ncbi:MAG: hypothetical protein LBB45_01055 [Methanobrevibacter sp.]|jgi:hypothetical protein|nr:hypothetical protein [Candidatus Methanovirga basalitermitum]
MIGILKPKFNLNKDIGLFLTTLINTCPANGPVSEIKNTVISLPVDDNGTPD